MCHVFSFLFMWSSICPLSLSVFSFCLSLFYLSSLSFFVLFCRFFVFSLCLVLLSLLFFCPLHLSSLSPRHTHSLLSLSVLFFCRLLSLPSLCLLFLSLSVCLLSLCFVFVSSSVCLLSVVSVCLSFSHGLLCSLLVFYLSSLSLSYLSVSVSSVFFVFCRPPSVFSQSSLSVSFVRLTSQSVFALRLSLSPTLSLSLFCSFVVFCRLDLSFLSPLPRNKWSDRRTSTSRTHGGG